MKPTIQNNPFGSAIRKARLEAEVGLREAAKKIGISPAYLSMLENNTQESVPSDELIQKICSAVKANYEQLRELSKYITEADLNSFRKKVDPSDVPEIHAFYRVAKANNITLKEAVEILKEGIGSRSNVTGSSSKRPK